MATRDINYENNIDLALNEIKRVVVEVVDTLPSTVTEGRIVSLEGDLYIGKGTAYVKLGGAGDVTALAQRVTAIETSAYATSGIDATKVGQIATNATNIGTLQTTVGDSTSGLVKDVAGLKTTVGDASSGLVKGVADNASAISTINSSAVMTSGITSAKVTKLDGIEAGAEVNIIEAVAVKDESIVTVSGKTATIDLDAYAKKSDVSSALTYKGTKSTYADLPASGQKVGDVWNIETADPSHDVKAGDNVAWTGTAWDVLGGVTDLSAYLTIASAQSTYVPKTTTVNGHALSGNVSVTASDVGLGNVDNTSDANKPISTATQTALDAKMNAFASAPTGGKLLVSVASDKDDIAEGTLTASEVATAIASDSTSGSIKKWVKDQSYVVQESGKGLYPDADASKLAGIASGAQVNVIETVKVNGSALTPTDKAVNITVPTDNASLANGAGYQTASDVSSAIAGIFKSANVTTTAGADTSVTGVTSGKTPKYVQVYNSSGEVVMCYVKVASGSIVINTSSAKTLTVNWIE